MKAKPDERNLGGWNEGSPRSNGWVFLMEIDTQKSERDFDLMQHLTSGC